MTRDRPILFPHQWRVDYRKGRNRFVDVSGIFEVPIDAR